MGTKFEYARDRRVNSPISRSSSNQRMTSASFSCVNDWDRSQKKEVIAEMRTEKRGPYTFRKEYQAGYQMEKNEAIQNTETIRKTMQMHEDVFKLQVRELHRLYQVQKTLMGEVKKQIEQSGIQSPPITTTSTMISKNSTYISMPHQDVPCPLSFDLQRRPINGREVDRASCSMEEQEVELTLSFGGKMSRTKPKMEAEKKLVQSLLLESNRSCPAPENSVSKQSHWLLHL
ncbi:hypothetical protein SAY86_001966 [Trapa natans]|uniref:Uncharacterized protein n=1 Tax=Trapa natans TaxID=22666 RepID=A0AAN7LET8_TRANT|nr:hypothetical protein SAY86_001966 [Trapa natans]